MIHFENWVKAKNWVIHKGVFKTKASFRCGKCKLNCVKVKTMRTLETSTGVTMPTAQCEWCGTLNAFFRGDRPLIYVQGI